ncbi:hypothetical protein GCM10011584_22130 [Nocardioides phosphati]|uniref:Pentapeptide MXKDX repeat protein n=1 Tax=Nocardioides phosphati TaxID=1867775 RepID=A0ABQ2NFZ5_9ACTN|nr:hypothetical protein [Nocardioides phosphati]GGO90414.1 hypothetical protein GCM10011584_22130 [Nocardioides phosphati]
MTSTALRRLLAVATVTGVLLTGAACGSDDTPMTPKDHSTKMTDDMSTSPMTEKSDPMTEKSDGMMSDSPMTDPSASTSDDMMDK